MSRIIDISDGFTSGAAPTSQGSLPTVTGSTGTPSSIVAGTGISISDVAEETIFIAGSGGAVDISANPQIEASSFVGARLNLIGTSDTNTVTVENSDGLEMPYSFVIGSGDWISFVWNGTLWVESNRSDQFKGSISVASNISAGGTITSTGVATANSLLIEEVSAPSTPPSGYFAIYAKSDGKIYTKNDAGTEVELGAASGSAPTPTMQAGSTYNIGITTATTSAANDSIKITSADHTALSGSNVGYIALPNSTSGQVEILSLTSDVTIDLTGAHWGLGTFGDRADYPLHVYAINDSGTVKIGVGSVPSLSQILGTVDSTTATDINQVHEILVNSALTGDSPAAEIAWFKANLDDSGGASEDLWSIQTGAGDLNVGKAPDGIRHEFVPTISGAGTVSNLDYEWWRIGEQLYVRGIYTFGTPAASDLTESLPSGLVIDTSRGLLSRGVNNMIVGRMQRIDSGRSLDLNAHWAIYKNTGSDTTLFHALDAASDTVLNSTDGNSLGTGETAWNEYNVPIVGWF